MLKPLEDYVFSYKQVNKKNTHSRITAGMLIIFVELDNDVENTDEFWNEFKIGMDQVRLTLPPGVLGVETLSNFGDTSALLITMQSDDKTYRELGDYMDRLKDRLRTVESVGTMSVTGKQNEQIAVYLNPEKLKHYALSESTVGATLLAPGIQDYRRITARWTLHTADHSEAIGKFPSRHREHDSACHTRRRCGETWRHS